MRVSSSQFESGYEAHYCTRVHCQSLLYPDHLWLQKIVQYLCNRNRKTNPNFVDKKQQFRRARHVQWAPRRDHQRMGGMLNIPLYDHEDT
jgi:hypothetical protein